MPSPNWLKVWKGVLFPPEQWKGEEKVFWPSILVVGLVEVPNKVVWLYNNNRYSQHSWIDLIDYNNPYNNGSTLTQTKQPGFFSHFTRIYQSTPREHWCYPPKQTNKKWCTFHNDSLFVERVIIFQGVFLRCSPEKELEITNQLYLAEGSVRHVTKAS